LIYSMVGLAVDLMSSDSSIHKQYNLELGKEYQTSINID